MLLGNRQLLSGFFVITLLLGVAFGRGYIVGRNSIPKERPSVPSPSARATKPQPGTYWQVDADRPAAS
jgi:hypothetical protein